jgi:hypothetical protein
LGANPERAAVVYRANLQLMVIGGESHQSNAKITGSYDPPITRVYVSKLHPITCFRMGVFR